MKIEEAVLELGAMKLRLWHVCPPESTIKLPRQINTPELDFVVLKSHQATLPCYPRTLFILLVPLFPLSSPYQPFSFFISSYFSLLSSYGKLFAKVATIPHSSLYFPDFPLRGRIRFSLSSNLGCPVSFFDEYCCWCCCLVTKFSLTLCNPMDCNPPGSSVYGVSQVRILEEGCHFLF